MDADLTVRVRCYVSRKPDAKLRESFTFPSLARAITAMEVYKLRHPNDRIVYLDSAGEEL